LLSKTGRQVRRQRPGARISRSKAPVFVLGCGRSGTKFLYHTLLSAGGFAVYHAESNAFNLLGTAHRQPRPPPQPPPLARRLLHQQALSAHRTRSERYRRPRARRLPQRRRLPAHRDGKPIARKQGVDRWAESTPLHLLYLPLIKKLIPEALVVHIIRRRPRRHRLPLSHRLDSSAALGPRSRVSPARDFWRWIVSKGRR